MDYLSAHHDCNLTAEVIANDLKEYGVSRSAVYRNLNSLEEEGLIRRNKAVGSNAAVIMFTGADKCKDKIHISCIKCGKTCHLSSAAASGLVDTVSKTQGFTLDVGETVLYGVCGECGAGKKGGDL